MFGIKKLDWLIIKSYIGPLILTFFVTTFLLLMQFLWKYIDDLVGKGLEWTVIVELLFFASMGLLQMSLPLAILCASIFIYGSMGENNELIAIKSTGISLPRIMLPLIFVNFIVAIMAFVYSNNVLPYSNLKLWSLMFDVKHQRPELNIKEGVFYEDIKDLRIKIKAKNPSTNMMYGVMIYDHRNMHSNSNLTLADSASMNVSPNESYLVLTLYNGVRYDDVHDKKNMRENRKKRPFQQQHFAKQQVLFELETTDLTRSNPDLFKHNSQMQNMNQLIYTIDSLGNKFDKQNNRAFTHYLNQNLFKSTNENKKDSIVKFESLFNNMNTTYKLQAVSRALNYARSAESYLETGVDNNYDTDIQLNKHRIELHKKFTLALACFIMFFVGAPFGAIVRKGGLGVPVIFSFVFYLIYYIMSMIGEKSVKSGEVSAQQGMWVATTIILIFGAYFTYMATRDRVISNPKLLIEQIFKALRIRYKRTKSEDSTSL